MVKPHQLSQKLAEGLDPSDSGVASKCELGPVFTSASNFMNPAP